jgi:hypothetical protein
MGYLFAELPFLDPVIAFFAIAIRLYLMGTWDSQQHTDHNNYNRERKEYEEDYLKNKTDVHIKKY